MDTLAAIVAALAALVTPCDATDVPRRHDAAIRAAVEHYWPPAEQHHKCRLKALLWVESRHRTDALSPAGAQGIAQFMPRTWEQARRAGVTGAASPYDANAAIRAAAWYQQWLRRRWPEPRPSLCRQRLTEASYNAGAGSVYRAQRLARADGRAGVCWPEIRVYLPGVTARHARETCRYVDQIDATTRRLHRRAPTPVRGCREAP